MPGGYRVDCLKDPTQLAIVFDKNRKTLGGTVNLVEIDQNMAVITERVKEILSEISESMEYGFGPPTVRK